MIIHTPALSVSEVKVFPLLFQAQLPDTLAAIRRVIPDWSAVHVIAEQKGPPRNAPSPDRIRDELLAKLSPMATLYSDIYTLTKPEIPAGTIATFVPDRLKPSFVSEYQGWKFVYYEDSRAALQGIFDRAVGGIPEGFVGLADALVKGEIQGQAVLEGWGGSVGVPSFKRTLEAIVDPESTVMFWDGILGYEASGRSFLDSIELVLGLLGVKNDRVYFDATNFSWFAAFYPGGQLRVGLLG